MHNYLLGEHTSMKNELYQTNVKSQGIIHRTSFSTICIDLLMHVHVLIKRLICTRQELGNEANYSKRFWLKSQIVLSCLCCLDSVGIRILWLRSS